MMSRWDRDDSYINRSTGNRREPPALCYSCGADVPDTPRFGAEATCDECRRNPPTLYTIRTASGDTGRFASMSEAVTVGLSLGWTSWTVEAVS